MGVAEEQRWGCSINNFTYLNLDYIGILGIQLTKSTSKKIKIDLNNSYKEITVLIIYKVLMILHNLLLLAQLWAFTFFRQSFYRSLSLPHTVQVEACWQNFALWLNLQYLKHHCTSILYHMIYVNVYNDLWRRPCFFPCINFTSSFLMAGDWNDSNNLLVVHYNN